MELCDVAVCDMDNGIKVDRGYARKISDGLHELGRRSHASYPLEEVLELCKSNGFMPVQEDGTPWSGWLCGDEGRATIQLASNCGAGNLYLLVKNFALQLQWYKLESGAYEFNGYIL